MKFQVDLTDEERGAISDIIWWIFGYRAASDDIELCGFHIEVLRKINTAWKEEYSRLAYDGRNKRPGLCKLSPNCKDYEYPVDPIDKGMSDES